MISIVYLGLLLLSHAQSISLIAHLLLIGFYCFVLIGWYFWSAAEEICGLRICKVIEKCQKPHGIVIVLIGQRACGLLIATTSMYHYRFSSPKRRFSLIKGGWHIILLLPLVWHFLSFLVRFQRKLTMEFFKMYQSIFKFSLFLLWLDTLNTKINCLVREYSYCFMYI